MSDHTFDASDWHERPSIEAYKEYHGISYGLPRGRDGRPLEAAEDPPVIPAAPLHRLVWNMLGDAPTVHTVSGFVERYDLDLEDLATLTRVAAGEAPYSTRDPKAEPMSLPGDRLADKLVAYVHVGAELARLLQLFVDGSDPMEATDDALAVLDVWRSLEAAALREVVGS